MLKNTHLYREIHEQPAALEGLLSAGREAIECLVAARRARCVPRCHRRARNERQRRPLVVDPLHRMSAHNLQKSAQ